MRQNPILGLDGARTDAILNAKVLEERFAKYESSFVMEEKAKTELANKDLERIEAEAIMVRAKLQQELPSKLEASLIEATAKAVARRSTKAITELAGSQEAKNAVVEYNNSYNKKAAGDKVGEIEIKQDQESKENIAVTSTTKGKRDEVSNSYNVRPKEYSLSYTEVKAALSSSHYEQIFRDHASHLNPDGIARTV